MNHSLRLIVSILLLAVSNLSAATRYVSLESTNPVPPYTNWATAARVIQDAVDAAAPGDTVLVTNGLYATGGRPVGTNLLSNRVAIEKPIRLESVNGPAVTIIEGARASAGDQYGNGDGAVRCVYLGLTNAVLSGFTLTNGHTRTSGDYLDHIGGGAWGGTWDKAGGLLTNCLINGNSAHGGGGAYYGTLNNCTLTGNSAQYGGGACYGTLNNCTLAGNSAQYAGGAYAGTLHYCTLTDNSATDDGGGAFDSELNNCTLTGNSAQYGGGACYGTLNNCTLTGNSAGGAGGGARASTLNNCTLTGNSAKGTSYWEGGGGAFGSTLNNCIVYFNTASGGANHYYCTFEYSCTTPLASGPGNIGADPKLVTSTHLSPASPCRGAGSAQYASGVDIDGEPWANPPSMGADEPLLGNATGPLSMSITVSDTNVAPAFPVAFTAHNKGRITQSVWDFGDGTLLTNMPFASHAWTAPGSHIVSLTGYNDSHREGVSTMVVVEVVSGAVHYVNVANPTPASPYASWATAATNIQDAVDAGTVAGALVLVSNGVYATGGRAVVGTETNRVAVSMPLIVRSVNGPAVTTIVGRNTLTNEIGEVIGYEGGRGVYLGHDSILSGFTLTNGRADTGGGVYCESVSAVVTNCVITGNSADYGGGAYGGTLYNCNVKGNWATERSGMGGGTSGGRGGGACGSILYGCRLTDNTAWGRVGEFGGSGLGGGAADGTLSNCIVRNNQAFLYGGGASGGTLNNCTLTGNAATNGGGVTGSTLNNCIVYYNTAALGANCDEFSILNYCCTTPLPGSGVGNTSAEPQLASASHLSVFSPCRSAGSAAYATVTDIDGEAWGTPPSIGCDEYHDEAVTGPLSVAITATYTNVAVGYQVNLMALIEGRTTLSIWDLGDGTLSLNQPYETHSWAAPGDYAVTLWAFNDSHPEGVSATVTIHVGPAQHYVAADCANPMSPYISWATAATNIQDAVDAVVIGGTVLVSNGVYATGGRAVGTNVLVNRVVVDKLVTVRSVRGPEVTVIRGYQAPGTTNGDGAIRCVYLCSGASFSGFTLTNGATRTDGDWERETGGGGLWCESTTAVVSNCVIKGNSAYSGGGGAYGGTFNNCTLTSNSADYGGGACQGMLSNCVLTGNSAYNGGGAGYSKLSNCTLTGNSAAYGGGASDGTLNNCTVTGNSAFPDERGYGGSGGGVSWGTLNNCTVTDNSARYDGGGAYGGTLNNCTLTGNSASSGGGAAGGALNNCIAYLNTALSAPNYLQVVWGSPINYSCTTPMPTNGVGNITNAPLFVDYAGGNLRLQSNSPCINAGLNAYAPGPTDPDGLPRIVSGTVDIGAYEFQAPGSLISYAWLQQYFLPTDGSADTTDPDTDGLTTWQEWRCQTNPTNALSALRLLTASRAGTSMTVSWQSVTGVDYFLERSTNLSASPPFTPLTTGIPGQPGTTSYTDTTATSLTPLFYRVGVSP